MSRIADIKRRLSEVLKRDGMGRVDFDAETEFHEHAPDDIAWLLKELERKDKALEYYATNWRSDVYVGPTAELVKDHGEMARAALKEEE